MTSTYLAEVENVNTVEVMDVEFLSYVRDYRAGHLTDVFPNVLSDRAEDGRGRGRRQFRFHKVLAEHRSIKLRSISVPDNNTEGIYVGSLQLKGPHFPETQPLNQQRGRAERE